MGEVARRLGKPFMPWQQLVADVALEIDPKTGRLAYQELGLTVPRQSGKSTWVLAKATHRASATGFFGGRQRLVYTAQTRQKAREKWEEDYAAELEAAASFKARVLVHKGNGNEHIRFTNGSRFGIEANTEKAGHGGTLDEAYIDEAFAQADNRLEQAFRPAMITRANKLLAWISTAGWLGGSPYLEAKVAAGRAAAQADTGRGMCYFEWSLAENLDPLDPANWWTCMPALGHTIDVEAIQSELDAAVLEGKLNDFKRAYCNLWVPKSVDEDPPVIDGETWMGQTRSRSQITGPRSFAVDQAFDGTHVSISVCGTNQDGNWHVELVERKRGTSWAVGVCQQLAEKFQTSIAIDTGGPAAWMIPQLEALNVKVILAGTRDVAKSAFQFFDAVTSRTLVHIGQEEMDQAVAAARWRALGEAQTWGRKSSTSPDISPVVSASLALWSFIEVPPVDVLNSIW